ncbi:MAG: hypothetical protein NZM37_03565 [Sandaracinaceae bacterium]|nr:hypothetical protein [Sandaracinaceae bacterium]
MSPSVPRPLYRSPSALWWAAVLSGLVASACSRDGGKGSDGGPGNQDALPPPSALRIEPVDPVLLVPAGASESLRFRAWFRESSGREIEVSEESTWNIAPPELGRFSGPLLETTPSRGGRGSVVASYRGMVATTTITIRVEEVALGPGANSDIASRLDREASPGPSPELLYPFDRVMLPPNLRSLEFHIRPNGGEAFELRFESSIARLRLIFGCAERVGDGCILPIDSRLWERLRNAAPRGEALRYRLRAATPAGNVHESEERTLFFAEEGISGGVYYWNAGEGSIDRFEFGVPGARPERFIDVRRTGARTCVGCHALSRDGSRIAVGTDFPTTTLQVFEVARRNRLFMLGNHNDFFPQQPNFFSFSPDARALVTSSLRGLRILDASTGAVMAEGLGGGPASQPDWSPDGNHIVFVRHDGGRAAGLNDVPGVKSGRIAVIHREGSGWSAPRELVAMPNVNHYYPAYSPDGRFIVYCRSPSNSNSTGSDDGSMGSDDEPTFVRDAELWIIPSDGSGPARKVNVISGLGDSWPKWDPTTYEHEGHPLFWLSWTSRRAYGLRLREGEQAQIWMAAFNPEAAARGEEGFYPPFWLPFQNIRTSNHIPQWVTRVERQPCRTNKDCPGEFCFEGRCFATPPLL